MSLFSLGADAARRKTVRAGGPTPPVRAELAGLKIVDDGGQESGTAPAAASSDNPLQALVLFIPAETVAIFVTVATGLFGAFPGHEVDAARAWYGFCLVLTPVFAWIGFATQWRKDHGGAYPSAADAPWFRIVASIFAFAVWGLAVSTAVGTAILCPSVTVADAGAGHAAAPTATCNAEAISGVVVIVVGAILTVLDGLIDYTPKPAQ